MALGERLVEKTKTISKQDKIIKKWQKDYEKLEELYQTRGIRLTEAEDKLNLYQKGGVMYCPDQDNYVTEAIRFPAYHETTFEQDIHPAIGTRLYNQFRFIKVVDGKMVKDPEKYRKYLSVL